MMVKSCHDVYFILNVFKISLIEIRSKNKGLIFELKIYFLTALIANAF